MRSARSGKRGRTRARPAKDNTFKSFVLDQLQGLAGLHCRAMFGGHGLYRGEDFFAIVFQGRLYFRTDEHNRAAYLERGMKPFRPNPRQSLPRYYEVPLDVIEDPGELVVWARAASARTRPGPP